MTKTDDSGPLPKADANSALQRQSVAAVQFAVAGSELVLREEGSADFGVDATLEALVAGEATNCRAPVQIKARSGLTTNADGSVSLSVAVANLKYLLNALSSLYILFIPERKELRFVFARDEEKRISADSAAWIEQETVTLRFVALLDPDAIGVINARIMEEARLHRKLRSVVAALAPVEGMVRIGLEGGEGSVVVRTGEDAAELLCADGMALVSWGFTSRALELAALLTPELLRADPKLYLVCGFAEFTNRNYLSAEPNLRRALANEDGLLEEDRRFLAFLMSAVALARGEITGDAFRARSDAWRSTAPVYLQLQYDILHLWTLHAETLPGPQRDECEARLLAVLAQTQEHPDVPRPIKQHAKLLTFFFEAQHILDSLMQTLAVSRDAFLWQFAYDKPPEVIVRQAFARLNAWRDSLQELIREVTASGHPPLICEALLSRDLCDTMIFGQLQISAAMAKRPAPEIDPELLTRIAATRELAARFDQPEFALRTLLLESDVEDLRGNAVRANQVSQRALREATALSYADISRVAASQLSGEMRTSSILKEIAALHADGGLDRMLAGETDEDLAQKSAYACEVLRIPADRVANVLDAAQCERAASNERITWCRHIGLLEDAAHTASRASLFLRRPERCCHCARFGHRSLIPLADWGAVLSAFKFTRCAGCTEREPLGQ